MKKNYFLTILALLFLFSCTREYLMESNDTIQLHSNSRVNKVSFEEMESFIKKNSKSSLPDYLKPNNLNKNTEQYITAIDTADIIKVVHNGITSFTLKINTLGDKDFTFSNLIINVHSGHIEEYIYHYIPDAQWLKNYIASKKGDYQGILKITDINGNNKTENHAKNSTTCMVEMHVPCFGAGCPCSDYNGVTYYIMATCTTGGGGSSGGNTGGPPSGGSPGGGGGGGTVPNVPTSDQINNFLLFLSPAIHAYISKNPDSLIDINNYFTQNGLNPKHQSFTNSILEYVTKKDIAWLSFNPIFTSAIAYKNQKPDSWAKISTIQDFAFDFMLQNSNINWTQFENWFSLNNQLSVELSNEFKNLSQTKQVEFIQINKDLDNFNNYIQISNPLDSPWLKKARQFAQKLENWSSTLGPKAKEKVNEMIDKSFIYALNKTATELYPNVGTLTESQRETQFQTNGKNSVAILLHEFANGKGEDTRYFPLNYDITQQFIARNVLNDIKTDFFNKLAANGLSYNQFIANGNSINGGYSFSPDHTTVEDSFNKHLNANWVQFFIGGASAKYYPDSENGWIIVTMSNGTSRQSLLLHVGENHPRNGTGINKPLSTIYQSFSFKMKVL